VFGRVGQRSGRTLALEEFGPAALKGPFGSDMWPFASTPSQAPKSMEIFLQYFMKPCLACVFRVLPRNGPECLRDKSLLNLDWPPVSMLTLPGNPGETNRILDMFPQKYNNQRGMTVDVHNPSY
jgi:hypothetical protein